MAIQSDWLTRELALLPEGVLEEAEQAIKEANPTTIPMTLDQIFDFFCVCPGCRNLSYFKHNLVPSISRDRKLIGAGKDKRAIVLISILHQFSVMSMSVL